MSVFFVFSDECGEYKQDRTEKFLKRHPYFVRASYIIRGEEWRALSQKHMELRSKYGLPPKGRDQMVIHLVGSFLPEAEGIYSQRQGFPFSRFLRLPQADQVRLGVDCPVFAAILCEGHCHRYFQPQRGACFGRRHVQMAPTRTHAEGRDGIAGDR